MRTKLTVKPFTFPSNNFLSSRNHEMKLAKIYKSIVFLLHVKTHPDSSRNEKPSLTVHQPSLKHSGIPQMNISLLKAFFRTMPLTVLISQSLLSAATLANEQPRYYIFTHAHTEVDWQILWSSCWWIEWRNREERSIFRWWTALCQQLALIRGWNKGTCCGKPTSTFPFG